ncbi:hypothetical protein DPMN_072643 [Dreissena polymorpha]|uniref:26S proteasome regulatory subunit RPN11 C-terminal domain-containing protein n=1 Tax=Dreissena polymorpha TaxID=45954 RepID=A0A9D4BXN5_DREPO|nr:hypothetical protein DPMN_072643 [Dreissena polymorpha]
MLLNLHKKSWADGLTLQDYRSHCTNNETVVKEMLELARNYHKVRDGIRLEKMEDKIAMCCALSRYKF